MFEGVERGGVAQPPVVSKGQVTTGGSLPMVLSCLCVCGRQLQGNFVCARGVLVLY